MWTLLVATRGCTYLRRWSMSIQPADRYSGQGSEDWTVSPCEPRTPGCNLQRQHHHRLPHALIHQLFTHESNTFLGEQYVILFIQTNGLSARTHIQTNTKVKTVYQPYMADLTSTHMRCRQQFSGSSLVCLWDYRSKHEKTTAVKHSSSVLPRTNVRVTCLPILMYTRSDEAKRRTGNVNGFLMLVAVGWRQILVSFLPGIQLSTANFLLLLGVSRQRLENIQIQLLRTCESKTKYFTIRVFVLSKIYTVSQK